MASTSAPGNLAAMLACIFYATMSVSMSFVTKMLFSWYIFKFPFFLMAMQMAFSAAVTSLFLFVPSIAPPTSPKSFSKEAFLEVVVPAVLFVANVVVGFHGMARVNVPMFLCLRRTSVAFSLAGEYLLLNKPVSSTQVKAISLIVGGTLVSGLDSLVDAASDASLEGFLYILVNNICTAGYLVLSKRVKHPDTKGLTLVFYQALTAFPLALIACMLFGEVPELEQFQHWDDSRFLALLACSGCFGILIVVSIILTNQLNSPTVLGVVGNFKDIVATILSMAVFGGFTPTLTSIAGLIISFCGSAWYTHWRLTQGSATADQATNITAKVHGSGDERETADLAEVTPLVDVVSRQRAPV